MLTEEQVEQLTVPFPQAALKADTSRGFELTSIKAAFVFERLNQVFGVCGWGWRYVHAPFAQTDREVTTEIALQYRVGENTDGTSPLIWENGDWSYRKVTELGVWSEPVFACGGNQVGKGGVPLTDARKSAVTDGLTKAASMLGIGHEVFKGQARASAPQRQSQGQSQSQQRPPAKKAKVPIPYKAIQEAPFMTTFEQCVNRFGKDPFYAYMGEVSDSIIAVGYENATHRNNLYAQLFGGDNPMEYSLGFFRLLSKYAEHLKSNMVKDEKEQMVPSEKEKIFAKAIVLYGVEHQMDWFGAQEAMELPEDIPL